MRRVAVGLILTFLATATGPGASHMLRRDEANASSWDVTTPRGVSRDVDFTTDEGTWMSIDVTPDGGTLVFDLLGHIYAMSAAGGEAKLLTRDAGISVNFQPAISPDGARIAFISDRGGQNNLWTMRVDGSDARIVEKNLRIRHSLPSWTSDGRYIVARRTPVDTTDLARPELWLYHVDGGRGLQLTRSPDQPGASEPSLTRDGRYLFFSIIFSDIVDPARGRVQLRRMDMRSGAIARITDGIERGLGADARMSSGGGFTPRVSPDGRWLAFGRRLASGTISYKGHQLGPRTALWIRDLETGAERLVLDPVERDIQEYADTWAGYLPGYAWDPSSKFLYVSQGGHIQRVDVVNREMTAIPFSVHVQRTISEMAYKRRRLEDGPLHVKFARWPAFSPDRRKLAFQAVGKIWIKELPNGQPHRLTPTAFISHEYSPAWSADGKAIAFTSWTDEDRGSLYTISSEGGQPTRLTSKPGEYLNPTWSTDGKTIVVVRGSGATLRGLMLSDNSSYEIVSLPAAGGGPQRLASVDALPGGGGRRRHITQPSFGPDNRVFYTELVSTGPGRGSRTELKSVRVDGGDERTELLLPYADEVTLSPDGRWLAFEEGDNVYLAPMPVGGAGGKPVDFRREPNPIWKFRALSTEGGNFPRWVATNVVGFGSADRAFLYDAATEKTETYRIGLEVPRQRATGTIVFIDARLITLEGEQTLEHGDIVVKDGRVVALGRHGSVPMPPSAHRIAANGKTIIPGIVDMHSHNHRDAAGILPIHDYEMAATLAYGVTTTLDPSTWSQNVFAQSELVEAGEVVGPRTFSTGDPVLSGDGPRRNELNSLEQAVHEARRLESYGAISLKQYLQPERRQRQWVSEAGRTLGINVTAEQDDFVYVLSMVMDGQTGWEHPFPQVPAYNDVTQFMGRAGIYHSATLGVDGPGPWGEQYFVQDRDIWEDAKLRRFTPWRKLEVHARRREMRPATDYTFPFLAQSLADMIAAGAHGATGGHGQQYGIASHWEIWMLASAMPPLQAIRVATLGGAEMLGLQDDLGSLRAGKLADFIVLQGNPLEDIRQTARIEWVVKGGTVYSGETLDEIWPRQRPFGHFFWEADEARPQDTKVIR